MGVEVERKFLLADDTWRAAAIGATRIRDGLIVASHRGKVRLRIEDGAASLTVKSPRIGMIRREFEYPIPIDDAEEMLATMCAGAVLEKTRYRVPHGGFLWTVDIYEGLLRGIEIAEIELDHVGQAFSRPPWAGREVTGDARFRKSMLRRMALQAGRPLNEPEVLRTPA